MKVVLGEVVDFVWSCSSPCAIVMTNFPSLRLNNSIQFLDTSAMSDIGLNFVLIDLSCDFSENLLFLSFKENPDSFVFQVAT